MLRQMVIERKASWQVLGVPCLLDNFILEVADCEVGPDSVISLPKLGTPKECFHNAGRIALESRNYDYVEGYVMTEDLAMPIHHAWLWDSEKKKVIETTLNLEGREAYYLGLKFDAKDFSRELFDWGYWGLFDGMHLNVELMRKIYPGVLDETD